jgi:signal transduction histidine kinase/DNA-binding response OmpR family regulator
MQPKTASQKQSASFQSVKSKVLAGFALASLALMLFWLGTRFVFGATLHNMHELSQPNNKIAQVNLLFQEYTRIDQKQRHVAVQPQPGRRSSIKALSDTLQAHIAELKNLYRQEERQYQRLDSIEQVIEKRNLLFWDFIQHRDELMSSRTLREQAQAMAQLIADSEPFIDSSLQVTAFRQSFKTISPPDTLIRTIAIDRSGQGTFLGRLFGKRRPAETESVVDTYFPSEPEVIFEETIDSIVQSKTILVQQDTILPALEAQLQEMLEQQRTQAARAAWSELEFLKAGNQLTSEILYMIYEIEEEELRNIEHNRASLSQLIHSSFSLFNGLLIGILLCLACLVYLILIDFSKSRRFRAQLVQAKEEAERLGQIKERFLSNMSHEIRTPLQSIIGYAEQMQKQAPSADSGKQAIYQSARHLMQIVNEILDYNRLVSDRFHLEAAPFSPAEVLEEVSTTMRGQAERKGLVFELSSDLPPNLSVVGDAFRLRQILYNLLGNAIKFTEHGSVSLKAVAQCAEERCEFQIRVSDTGIGIPANSMESIFKQFEQAEGLDRQRYGGTGLGLSIVKALVEMQGGELSVESEAGYGATFSLCLPYPLAAAVQAPIEADAATAADIHGFEGTIHLVDDDAYTLRLCQQILASCQVRTKTYAAGHRLLESGKVQAGDIVLTDINLPRLSGYDLLSLLRQQVPSATILAMTAQALPEEQAALRRAGFEGILVKPFVEKDLWQILRPFALKSAPAEAPAKSEASSPEHSDLLEETALHELVAAENSKDLAQLQAALQQDDATTATAILHRLAGREGQFGDQASYLALRRLEVGLRAQPDLASCRLEIEGLIHQLSGTSGASF